MIRATTIRWIALVACVGYGMFQVKYEVQQLEDELARVNKSIASSKNAIHVLNAEWSFLTQPNRLDQMTKRYLTLGPIGNPQIGQLDGLPRPPASPAAPAVAANTVPPTTKVPASTPAPATAPAAQPPGPQSAGTRVATAKMRTE